MPNVQCTISNCKHWEAGGRCKADSILIDADIHAGNFQVETGLLDHSMHLDYAPTNQATMCHTFTPKSE